MLTDRHTKRILATCFGVGRTHDFALFKAHWRGANPQCRCLADSGYLGLNAYHANSQVPRKQSKHHPLSASDKAANRRLAQERVVAEHIIGRLKVFRILAECYRNRRQRFALRFNLIAALYNYELPL